jgi:stage V sporulation protein B
LAAGGAILGVSISCLVSVIYLKAKVKADYNQLPVTEEKAESFRATAKRLLIIAVPITIGSAGLSLLNVVETGLYMDRLVHLVESNQYMGHMVTADFTAQRVATTIKGVYNMGQTIFNMPISFILPITVSVIPAITSQLTLKNTAGVRSTEESAARITGLLTLPCAVGLGVLAKPILAVLGGYEGELLDIGATCLSVMGLNVFLYSISQYTTAVLQAHEKAHLPVINMLLCGILKLVTVYVLVGNPNIGILGAPIGAALCYCAIAVLNFVIIRKYVPQRPALVKNLFRPLLPAVAMGGVAYGVWYGMSLVTTSDLLLCGVPVAAGALVYVVLAVLFKSITAEDCQLLPGGDRIAKLLKL